MNKSTLDKLDANPHYKLNKKQKVELSEKKRKPMIVFGATKKHNNKKPIHSTGREKVGVTGSYAQK